MPKVTGFGGAFLRVENPQALYDWYSRHLGLTFSDGGFQFAKEAQRDVMVLAFFPKSSGYFPTTQTAMLNFQVDDLDGVLDQLEHSGVSVDQRREQYEYGRFGWFTDPEGNRVELWQPGTPPS